MNEKLLMKAEIFIFLAFIFLFFVILYGGGKSKAQESEYQENPPIIILSESNQNYRFNSGSAVIPNTLEIELQSSIIPQLNRWSELYECNAIMVIGHTDDEAVRISNSNLDKTLNEALKSSSLQSVRPGSNVDLGMMRAIAVLNELRRSKKNGIFSNIEFWLPYSAGQLIKTDDKLDFYYDGSDDKSRRRIEIILHKHSKRKYSKQ